MFIPGGEGLGLVIILGSVFGYLIPFLIGFIISYFVLKRIFIDNQNKTFIKLKGKRLIISILISIIFGYLAVVFFGRFFVDMSAYIINSFSR